MAKRLPPSLRNFKPTPAPKPVDTFGLIDLAREHRQPPPPGGGWMNITTPATLTSPSASATGTTTASLSVTSNKTGTLFWIVSVNATVPTAAQVQAGKDGTGATAAASSSQSMPSTGVQNTSVTGLVSGTTFFAFWTTDANVSPPTATFATTVYTGPGDIVASAIAWFGLRAFARANIGSNILTVRRSSDNATKTFVAFANGFNTSDSFFDGSNFFVTKLFDQSGNGRDVSQGTNSQQPQLILNSLGSHPLMQFSKTSSQFLQGAANSAPTQAQPISSSMVAKYSGGGAQSPIYSESSDGNVQIGFNESATNDNTLYIYAGILGANVTALDNTLFAINVVYNGASSITNLNGTETSGLSAGTNGYSNASSLLVGADTGGAGNFHNGLIAEVGSWPVAFSGANRTSLNSNQRTYWGF